MEGGGGPRGSLALWLADHFCCVFGLLCWLPLICTNLQNVEVKIRVLPRVPLMPFYFLPLHCEDRCCPSWKRFSAERTTRALLGHAFLEDFSHTPCQLSHARLISSVLWIKMDSSGFLICRMGILFALSSVANPGPIPGLLTYPLGVLLIPFN